MKPITPEFIQKVAEMRKQNKSYLTIAAELKASESQVVRAVKANRKHFASPFTPPPLTQETQKTIDLLGQAKNSFTGDPSGDIVPLSQIQKEVSEGKNPTAYSSLLLGLGLSLEPRGSRTMEEYFGKTIVLLQRAGWTQKKIAKFLGISQPVVSKIWCKRK